MGTPSRIDPLGLNQEDKSDDAIRRSVQYPATSSNWTDQAYKPPPFVYPVKPKNTADAEQGQTLTTGMVPAPGVPESAQQPSLKPSQDYDSQVSQAWANYQYSVLGIDPDKQTQFPSDYIPSTKRASGELDTPHLLGATDANADTSRPAADPNGLVGNTGKRDTAEPTSPPQVLQTNGSGGVRSGGGGGGGLSVGGIIGDYIQSSNAQQEAMLRERDARYGKDVPPARQTWGGQDADSQAQGLVPQATSGFGGLAEAETEQGKKFDAARSAMASEKLSQARNAYYERQHIIDRYQELTEAYANGKVDPDKYWNDKNVPQKIATFAGAFFLGLGGRPETALNYVNEQVDKSIAIQQQQLERYRVAAGHYQNIYDLALNNTKNVQEAYDFTRAVYLDGVISDSMRALAPYRNEVNKAEIDQYIAMLRQQRDLTLAKFMAKSGGGGAAPDGWLTTDSKSFVTDPATGQQYLINNPTQAPHVDAQLDAYTRIKSALERGRQIIPMWGLNPMQDLEAYNQGSVIDNAIIEAESKLASARGVPQTILTIIRGQKPTFASPSSRLTASRIDALEQLLDQWKHDMLTVNNARPFETRTGPGVGKHASELTTYARPSQAPAQGSPPVQAPPAKQTWGSFKPNQPQAQ